MQITGYELFIGTLFLMLSYVWVPPAWLLLLVLTPKSIVQRYFKAPHFTVAELALFDHFPGSLARTMIFSTVCVNPKWGAKRQISAVPSIAPGWYVVISKIFVVGAVGHAFLFLVPLFLMIAHAYLFEF